MPPPKKTKGATGVAAAVAAMAAEKGFNEEGPGGAAPASRGRSRFAADLEAARSIKRRPSSVSREDVFLGRARALTHAACADAQHDFDDVVKIQADKAKGQVKVMWPLFNTTNDRKNGRGLPDVKLLLPAEVMVPKIKKAGEEPPYSAADKENPDKLHDEPELLQEIFKGLTIAGLRVFESKDIMSGIVLSMQAHIESVYNDDALSPEQKYAKADVSFPMPALFQADTKPAGSDVTPLNNYKIKMLHYGDECNTEVLKSKMKVADYMNFFEGNNVINLLVDAFNVNMLDLIRACVPSEKSIYINHIVNREIVNDPATKMWYDNSTKKEKEASLLKNVHTNFYMDADPNPITYSAWNNAYTNFGGPWQNMNKLRRELFFSNLNIQLGPLKPTDGGTDAMATATIELKTRNGKQMWTSDQPNKTNEIPECMTRIFIENKNASVNDADNNQRISATYQCKRSGDWLQALSCLDKKRAYVDENLDKVILKGTNIILVTHDRVLLYYGLLLGLDVIFTVMGGKDREAAAAATASRLALQAAAASSGKGKAASKIARSPEERSKKYVIYFSNQHTKGLPAGESPAAVAAAAAAAKAAAADAIQTEATRVIGLNAELQGRVTTYNGWLTQIKTSVYEEIAAALEETKTNISTKRDNVLNNNIRSLINAFLKLTSLTYKPIELAPWNNLLAQVTKAGAARADDSRAAERDTLAAAQTRMRRIVLGQELAAIAAGETLEGRVVTARAAVTAAEAAFAAAKGAAKAKANSAVFDAIEKHNELMKEFTLWKSLHDEATALGPVPEGDTVPVVTAAIAAAQAALNGADKPESFKASTEKALTPEEKTALNESLISTYNNIDFMLKTNDSLEKLKGKNSSYLNEPVFKNIINFLSKPRAQRRIETSVKTPGVLCVELVSFLSLQLNDVYKKKLYLTLVHVKNLLSTNVTIDKGLLDEPEYIFNIFLANFKGVLAQDLITDADITTILGENDAARNALLAVRAEAEEAGAAAAASGSAAASASELATGASNVENENDIEDESEVGDEAAATVAAAAEEAADAQIKAAKASKVLKGKSGAPAKAKAQKELDEAKAVIERIGSSLGPVSDIIVQEQTFFKAALQAPQIFEQGTKALTGHAEAAAAEITYQANPEPGKPPLPAEVIGAVTETLTAEQRGLVELSGDAFTKYEAASQEEQREKLGGIEGAEFLGDVQTNTGAATLYAQYYQEKIQEEANTIFDNEKEAFVAANITAAMARATMITLLNTVYEENMADEAMAIRAPEEGEGPVVLHAAQLRRFQELCRDYNIDKANDSLGKKAIIDYVKNAYEETGNLIDTADDTSLLDTLEKRLKKYYLEKYNEDIIEQVESIKAVQRFYGEIVGPVADDDVVVVIDNIKYLYENRKDDSLAKLLCEEGAALTGAVKALLAMKGLPAGIRANLDAWASEARTKAEAAAAAQAAAAATAAAAKKGTRKRGGALAAPQKTADQARAEATKLRTEANALAKVAADKMKAAKTQPAKIMAAKAQATAQTKAAEAAAAEAEADKLQADDDAAAGLFAFAAAAAAGPPAAASAPSAAGPPAAASSSSLGSLAAAAVAAPKAAVVAKKSPVGIIESVGIWTSISHTIKMRARIIRQANAGAAMGGAAMAGGGGAVNYDNAEVAKFVTLVYWRELISVLYGFSRYYEDTYNIYMLFACLALNCVGPPDETNPEYYTRSEAILYDVLSSGDLSGLREGVNGHLFVGDEEILQQLSKAGRAVGQRAAYQARGDILSLGNKASINVGAVEQYYAMVDTVSEMDFAESREYLVAAIRRQMGIDLEVGGAEPMMVEPLAQTVPAPMPATSVDPMYSNVIQKPVPMFNLSAFKTRKVAKRRAANTFTNVLRRVKLPPAVPTMYNGEPDLSEFSVNELRAARAQMGPIRGMVAAYGGKRRTTRKFSGAYSKKRQTRKR